MIRLEPVAAALLARILCIPHPTFMSHIGEDDERSTDISRHRRNRGDKIKAIAAQSAAKDLEITRLRTVIRELEVENAVLKSHLAESRQTVHNLAGISSRAAPAEALSSPWSAHSPSSFSVATTTSQGFNVASGAWHGRHEGKPSISLRLGHLARPDSGRGRGSGIGHSPSPQERRAASGRGQGPSPGTTEPSSQNSQARQPHGRGNPRGGSRGRP